MIITATVTVRVVQANGDATEVSETVVRHEGDNPRFIPGEVEDALRDPTAAVLGRFAATMVG